MVDGKKQFWAVRIIGKKEEEKEFIVREEQNERKDEEIDNEPLQTKEEMEKKTSNVAEPKQNPPVRRVSPREHASTRSLEASRTLAPPVKKPRARLTKVKRMMLYYKVEWEGYPLEDATWNALREIACEQGCTVDELCCHIDLNFAQDEPFAPAARRYVLRYVAERMPNGIELPAELRFLRELRGVRSAQ